MQFAQCPQLAACQGVNGRCSVLHAVNRHRCGLEIDLGPLQIAQLGSPQSVPERQQDHGLVSVRSTVAFAPFDQLLDLTLSEVFAGPDLGVFGSARGHFPYFGVW